MKTLKPIIIILIAAAIIGLIIYSLMPKPVECEPMAVVTGPLEVTVDEEGKTRVRDRYTVYSPQTGTIKRIMVKAGDSLEAGTVITALYPLEPPLLDERSLRQAQAKVKSAEAQRDQAREELGRTKTAHEFASKELERSKKLRDGNLISSEQFDQAVFEEASSLRTFESANFALQVMEHELVAAQEFLKRIENASNAGNASEVISIQSPVNGTVLRVFRESEGVIQAGEPLIEVGDPRSLELVVDLLTVEAVKVKSGEEARILRWGGDTELKARVRMIEPSGFTKISALGIEEQRVNVILDPVDAEAWNRISDGYHVDVRIIIWHSQDVLKIPTSALFRHGEDWAVYVVKGQKAHLRLIGIEKRNPLEASVSKGLSKGEQVILYPSDNIKEGVRVNPVRNSVIRSDGE